MSLNIALWEANMLEWLGYVKSYAVANASTDSALLATYYDGGRVFELVRAYTGDNATWVPAIVQWRNNYRDYYVIPNHGGIIANYGFSAGLRDDYLIRGDGTSLTAVDYLSTPPTAVSVGMGYLTHTPATEAIVNDILYTRDIAYNLMHLCDRGKCGLSQHTGIDPVTATAYYTMAEFADICKGHLRTLIAGQNLPFIHPFMIGITCRALIEYYEYISTFDDEFFRLAANICDYIWKELWLPASQSFRYADRPYLPSLQNTSAPLDDLLPAPEVNEFVGPVCEWLYQQTTEPVWRTRADAIFNGCLAVYSGGVAVSGAYLGGRNATSVLGKQVNESYWWSFYHVNLRATGVPVKRASCPGLGSKL